MGENFVKPVLSTLEIILNISKNNLNSYANSIKFKIEDLSL